MNEQDKSDGNYPEVSEALIREKSSFSIVNGLGSSSR